MKFTMDVTLSGKVLKKVPVVLNSFKESLGMDFAGMTDQEIQAYMCPQDGDYMKVPVRMLSATEVQNNTINFGHMNGAALRKCVELFNGLIILKDHHFSVDNWLGKTEGAFWDEATPDVPFGITGMMNLDTKSDPKVCRGIASGALDSVSVTISFEYEKSHPSMSEMDFYMRLGEVVDGKTVQALVTKVNRVYELSVVWQGADQFAKTKPTGEDDAPGLQSNSQSFSTQEVSVDPKKLAALLGLTVAENATEESLKLAIEAHFKAIHDALEAKLAAATASTTELTAKVTALTEQLTAKTTEVTTLTAEVATLKTNATLGATTLKAGQDEALRLYNLVEGDKAVDSMRALISAASLDVANGFIASYKERAEAIAPLHCSKCGCADLTRQTATQSNTQDASAKQVDSLETARLKTVTNSIHG